MKDDKVFICKCGWIGEKTERRSSVTHADEWHVCPECKKQDFHIGERPAGYQTQYQKYEFCKYMECGALTMKKDFCWVDEFNCKFTAKTFHKWLKKEGFKIVKP